MPRKPRVNPPGLIHHVTIRASFCQMTAHAHLLVREGDDVPLARCLHLLDSRYGRHVNARRDRIGHVQATCDGDNLVGHDAYLRAVLAYIWRNPRARGASSTPRGCFAVRRAP